jgi:hypothetical protein
MMQHRATPWNSGTAQCNITKSNFQQHQTFNTDIVTALHMQQTLWKNTSDKTQSSVLIGLVTFALQTSQALLCPHNAMCT